jgi:hypothetical protein
VLDANGLYKLTLRPDQVMSNDNFSFNSLWDQNLTAPFAEGAPSTVYSNGLFERFIRG